MTGRRPFLIVVAGLVALVATACSSPSDRALRVSTGALRTPTPSTTTTAPPNSSIPCTDPTLSLRPDQPLPVPGAMPEPSTMHDILQRGMLKIGVDEGTLDWGFRDPQSGDIKGLDVDLLQAVATAIFGDYRGHLSFTTLTTAQRVDAVSSGQVDMVASLLTATCDRWQKVDFSTVYYEAHQDVLVPIDSPIHTLADLAGRTVCATRGSTSITNIRQKVPTAKIYPVDARADCLVALQEGSVDAITSDDTILASFEAQEKVPHTRTLGLGASLSNEPYAIAIAQGRPDLVRFVNSVLEHMREDGELKDLYDTWLKKPPTPPAAGYQR